MSVEATLARALRQVARRGHMGHMKFRRMPHCAFCESKPGSKEHAWPQWLLDKLATAPQQLIGHVEGKDPGFNPLQKAIKIPCVCHDCNTKWMAKTFEEAAQPLMEPMIDGKAVKLDKLQQALLAGWIAKTAMIFEYVTHERDLYYSNDERRHFRASVNPAPPEWSGVWLGRFVNDTSDKINFLTVGNDASSSDGGLRAYQTFMVFGQLAIQIVTIRSYQREPIVSHLHPNHRRAMPALTRIWPTERVARWPADETLGLVKTPTLFDFFSQFHNPTGEQNAQFSDEVIRVVYTENAQLPVQAIHRLRSSASAPDRNTSQAPPQQQSGQAKGSRLERQHSCSLLILGERPQEQLSDHPSA